MRSKNTSKAVLLDAVPERRTERCSPRFRRGDRFCELRFRYQFSPTGREGEKCRPLDHRWQIPFIHSTRFITSSNFYIYIWQNVLVISFMWYIIVCLGAAYLTIAQALLQKQSLEVSAPFCVPYGMCWCMLTQNRWHLRMCICWGKK